MTKIQYWLISNELISYQDRIRIIKEFEESNRKIAQNYLGKEVLFSSEVPHPTPLRVGLPKLKA